MVLHVNPLHEGDTVRLKPFQLRQKEWTNGVVERLDERSYEIETADESTYRCNRIHLRKTNEPPLRKLSVNPYGPQPTSEMQG